MGQVSSWKVHEDDSTYAFLDISPYSEFHTLVVPKRHFASVFDLPSEEMASLSTGVKAVVDLLAQKIGITDVQILIAPEPLLSKTCFTSTFTSCPEQRAMVKMSGELRIPSGGQGSMP